tara:strand:- start:2903 stop:4021 length:1119 start_codon:yes stop_codon:yes gene_type:complete
MLERIHSVVIGAGVIGLAIARNLALSGRDVIVIEMAGQIGTETSSRSSEVIHAGIYYPLGSLKAQLCVEGRKAIYEYCDQYGIPYRRTGKLIVATQEYEKEALKKLQAKGLANGVDDLQWLDAADARAIEPALSCVAALMSPSTGILDSHAFMLTLQGEAESHGAIFAMYTKFLRGDVNEAGLRIRVGYEDGEMELLCNELINAAGLAAQNVARNITGMPADIIPELYLSKGNYFTANGTSPFRRLIYPLPESAGLGVHLTLDLANNMRFGPDQHWVDSLNYDVDKDEIERFYEAIRKYYPKLCNDSLKPGYAGIRPKLQAPGTPPSDFLIQCEKTHGVKGLLNLFGIESPGLTASLAIAKEVQIRLETPTQ